MRSGSSVNQSCLVNNRLHARDRPNLRAVKNMMKRENRKYGACGIITVHSRNLSQDVGVSVKNRDKARRNL
jgi:hypothetical protein